MDTHQPWRWIEGRLDELDRRRLRRRLRVRQSAQQPAEIVIDGRTLVNFSSNDYLGLASDSRLADAARRALDESGFGSGASPLITGRGRWHARLEQALAEFEGAEAALLFPSGYAANLGAVSSLAGRGDVVVSDERNHASIIDGCRLSRAEVRVYRHNDVDHADSLLRQWRSRHGAGRALLVTDSLFSMDGDLAPLSELRELARRHDAMLLVDEAHATGVLGESGRGGCELAGIDGPDVLRVGTLSKAAGSIGGFVVGPAVVIDYLTNVARTQFYSTALPESAAAASAAAVGIWSDEPWRRERLLASARRVRQRLREQTWRVPDGHSQIVPVVLADPQRAMAAAAELDRRGLLAPAIRPPSVPQGQSLIRISLSAAHDDTALDKLLEAMRELAPSFAGGDASTKEPR